MNADEDRKSTRLNSSHLGISYAVFCLKKNLICSAGSPSPASWQSFWMAMAARFRTTTFWLSKSGGVTTYSILSPRSASEYWLCTKATSCRIRLRRHLKKRLRSPEADQWDGLPSFHKRRSEERRVG